MLPAKALFYALLVLLLTSILSGSLIMMAQINRLQFSQFQTRETLIRNANSGINLLRASGETLLNPKHIDLYGNGNDSVVLETTNWGVFKVGRSTAFSNRGNQQRVHTKICLFGHRLEGIQRSALYLTDRNKPLTICGNARIKGTAFLPEAGIKRGFIEGQPYTGEQMIFGAQKQSEKQIIGLGKAMEKILITNIDLEKLPFSMLGDSTHIPFTEKGIQIHDQIITIQNQILKGKVKLSATESVIIAKEATIEHVIIEAPNIIIESGFQGTLQAIASESLTVEPNVILNYPSALLLLPGSENERFVSIDRNAQISGVIIVFSDPLTSNPAHFKLEETGHIIGQVVIAGVAEIRGAITGHLSCNALFLKTEASIYDNHLLDAELSYNELPDVFAGTTLFDSNAPKSIIKWLD
ncbi:MAG: hypothetical protein AAF502_14565 [Bacteroidota bacterium]